MDQTLADTELDFAKCENCAPDLLPPAHLGGLKFIAGGY